jgi:hypothetical protein
MKDVLKQALEKIATVNAMDYEYQAWAREALAQPPLPVQKPVATDAQIALLDPWMRPAAAKELLTQVLALTPPAAQPVQEPDELTIAYMSGLYDGKKKRPWVGLTDEEIEEAYAEPTMRKIYQAIETALKEKNT